MEIPKDYPLVVGVCLAMSWQMWTQGGAISAFRAKIFNEEFMKKEFGGVHRNELKEEIGRGGAPDCGSGIYANKLSYKDWYRFNVLQRIHLNYVESISLAHLSTLASGLYEPKYAAGLGLLYIAGRAMYSHFYKQKGGALNKGRIAGIALCILSALVNSAIFFTNLYKQYKS